MKVLIGQVFESVCEDGKSLFFKGKKSYKFYHEQDCCEDVYIEDITGDLQDLVGSPIIQAEEVSNWDYDKPPQGNSKYGCCDTFTWTFYKFATVKGYVTVRWLGISNGFYSESINFKEID